MLREPTMQTRSHAPPTLGLELTKDSVCSNEACGFNGAKDPSLWGATPSGSWLCKVCWQYANEHDWVNREAVWDSSDVLPRGFFPKRLRGELVNDVEMGNGVGDDSSTYQSDDVLLSTDTMKDFRMTIEEQLTAAVEYQSQLLAENATLLAENTHLRALLAHHDPSFSMTIT